MVAPKHDTAETPTIDDTNIQELEASKPIFSTETEKPALTTLEGSWNVSSPFVPIPGKCFFFMSLRLHSEEQCFLYCGNVRVKIDLGRDVVEHKGWYSWLSRRVCSEVELIGKSRTVAQV